MSSEDKLPRFCLIILVILATIVSIGFGVYSFIVSKNETAKDLSLITGLEDVCKVSPYNETLPLSFYLSTNSTESTNCGFDIISISLHSCLSFSTIFLALIAVFAILKIKKTLIAIFAVLAGIFAAGWVASCIIDLIAILNSESWCTDGLDGVDFDTSNVECNYDDYFILFYIQIGLPLIWILVTIFTLVIYRKFTYVEIQNEDGYKGLLKERGHIYS
eukprot:TRINITY_DN359_c1_g1_i1.p1 TRINITY_DN359_c1_g1~~TRINITY_DN359_c1_g1_i1.p1  ORF type:complete len:218 (+),score=74.87 TRINITY_DN359_c1_g1_i1:116-769(+)